MKTFRKFLILLISGFVALQSVNADTAVKYSEISSVKDLNAVVASSTAQSFKYQFVASEGSDLSSTASVSVPKEGWLFLAGFCKRGNNNSSDDVHIQLFSDKNLISQIGKKYASGASTPLIKYVSAGTYYFNLNRNSWGHSYNYTCSVFPAFRPRVRQIIPVSYNTVSSIEGLESLINSGVTPSSYEKFEYYQETYAGNIYKVTLPSKGTLFMKKFAVNGNDRDSDAVNFSVYSDSSLYNMLVEGRTGSDRLIKLELQAGTYYYTTYSYTWASDTDVEVRTFLGFAPDVKLSAPKLTQYKRYSKKITGRAAAGSTVHLSVQKKKYTAKVNASGKFTIKLKTKLKPGKKIKVYVTLGSKRSKTTTVKVR